MYKKIPNYLKKLVANLARITSRSNNDLNPNVDASLMDINLVKEVIKTEQQNNGKVWIEFSRLAQLCKTRYRLAVTKEFFIENTSFRVYRTPNPLEIYITLAETLNTFHYSAMKFSIPDKSDSKSIFSKQAVVKTELQQQAITLKSIKQVPSINSCEALEQALFDILREMEAIPLGYFVEISVLTKNFYKVYGQPIKPLLNDLLPGLKFIEFLQYSDLFVLEKIGGKWTVALKDSCNF